MGRQWNDLILVTNPYAPPESLEEEDEPEDLLEVPIVLEIAMDAEYVTTALDRTRRRDPIRKIWMVVRWPCAALLLLTACILAFNAPFYFAIGFAAFTIGSFFAYRIDDLYYVWSLRRAGWIDILCTITLSNEGYRIESRGFDLTVPWSSFQCADIFDDGLLLFQTVKSSPWIPWSAISTTADRDRLIAFVLVSFASNHKMHRKRFF